MLITDDEMIQFVIDWETGGDPLGAYHYDKNDPGGATKWGISKRAHPHYNIRELTKEDAIKIYKNEYLSKVKRLSEHTVDQFVLFDASVNIGYYRVSGWWKAIPHAFILHQRRKNYYWVLSQNSQFARFYNGWMNRCKDLEVKALEYYVKDL